MCGIFAYFSKRALNKASLTALTNGFGRISHRGPDNHNLKNITDKLTFGFHRLAIVDPSFRGNQPLHHPKKQLMLICNGEIYNHEKLKKEYGIDTVTDSDCEVILHLYEKFGIHKALQLLDTESFAFCLYDGQSNNLIVARDRFGVRPLYYHDQDGQLAFASEGKALEHLPGEIKQFEPSTYKIYDMMTGWGISMNRYYSNQFDVSEDKDISAILSSIRYLFTRAVQKRMMADRKIGALLSGGLDSSLVCALIAQGVDPSQLNTFAIGIEGSTDLVYAKAAAKYIGTQHHSVELHEKEFLRAIPDVIESIESYDVTTVRASVGNWLIGKYISENTDVKVVFNGDGSDEQSGYLYLRNAPSEQAFHEECKSLLNNIHYFDVLRSDRSMTNWGLESRSPFLDNSFVDYYMSIHPSFKIYDIGIEKYLLRKAFNSMDILPDSVLWRPKEAFSDGCSSVNRSWHVIIQEHVDTLISDEEFRENAPKFTHNEPKTKEAYYYRKLFNQSYPNRASVIPHTWAPKWSTNPNEPSARELPGYKK